MSPARIHTRIIQHPFAHLVQGGRLDSYDEKGRNLALDIQGFQVISSEVFEHDGKLYDRVAGRYIPLRFCFSNVSDLKRDEFFTALEGFVENDPSRVIAYMLSWRQPRKQDIFHMIGLRGPIGADMNFFARDAIVEKGKAQSGSVSMERDWSPAPVMPGRLVPQPTHLHRRFGGDPITVKLNGHAHQHRLFIGGLDIQPEYRPQVDCVLNLGEQSSYWVKEAKLHPEDRAESRGEGSQGMTVAQLREEAKWVIERLKSGKRVLVHCVAGMNRSSTVCCAVLILLEGLTAEAALERVREHHPWARPDSYHWLGLRWLANS